LTLYLADTSAWNRADRPAVTAAWEQRLATHSLATCALIRLEILYSARSAKDYEQLAAELSGLHELPCGTDEIERALEVQRALSKRGGLFHRSVKIPDLVIAACAEHAGAIVWHYDEDFDRVAEVTGQSTEWIASRGSL